MSLDYSLIGKRLADIRIGKGWSQNKLAEKTNLSGNYISHIENNRSIPSLETLMALCEALDVTPDYILLGTDMKQKDYLVSDITQKLEQCTESERRIILLLIDALAKERKRKK